MKKRKFSLKEEYIKSWKYILKSKNFIFVIIGLFVVSAIVGFLVPAPEGITKIIFEFIEELLRKTEGLSTLGLIRFIFVNNVQSSFFGMVFGILFGILPLISTVANGYLLGFVSSWAVGEGGFLTLFRLLPHGIFELPALFISLGIGLRLGMFLFRKNKSETFFENLINALRVFFLIVLPLLVIAAIIEGVLI